MMRRPPFPRRIVAIALSGALAAALPLVGRAQIDDIQLKLARQLDLPLRWDNLDQVRPYWLAGVKPHRLADRPWHAVRLAPGARVALKVPAGERLRLLRADGQPFAEGGEALHLLLSNGSGVSTRLQPIPGDDGLSLLADAYPGHAGAVYVERPATADSDLELAIFISRRSPFPALAPYRRVHPLSSPTTRELRRAIDGAAQTYWQLRQGEPAEVSVRGPARLALQGRFVYPAGETGLLQGGWVKLSLDDQPFSAMQFETSADSAALVLVDAVETPVSRQQEAYVEIPPGEHRLRLQANAPFLVRLLEQEDPDYLVPALNEPGLPAREARQQPVDPVLRLATWGQETAQTVAALGDGDSPAAVRQAALRLIQDNRRRDGSILAAVAMQHAASRRRDEPAVQQEANAFLELHTYYRDIFPEHKLVSGAARYAWYLTPRLLDIGERGRGSVAAAQHEANLLAWMDAGIFLPLPEYRPEPPAIAPNELSLDVHFDTDLHDLREADRGRLRELARAIAGSPEMLDIVGHTDIRASEAHNQGLSQRRARAVAAFLVRQGINPSRIRIAARAAREPVGDNLSDAGRQANRRTSVRTVLPGSRPAPAVHVYALPERSAPSWLRVAVHADDGARGEKVYLQFDDATALELQVEAAPEFPADRFQPTDGETALLLQRWLRGEFGGDTLSAAFSQTQIPAPLIPAGVTEVPLPPGVKKIRVWREKPGQPGAEIWLAMKLRMAKPYALSETGLLAAIAELAPGEDGPAALTRAIALPQPAAETLAARDLDSHLQPLARLVRSEYRHLTGLIAAPPPAAASQPGAGAAAERLAQGHETAGQWLPALEQWAQLAASGDAELRERAEQGRIRNLFALGEAYLGEQRLKQRLLYAADPGLRRQAAEQLAAHYRRTDDREAMVTLSCAAFVTDPDADNLARLVAALHENGMSELALAAGLLLPREKRPLTVLLRAATQSQWWRVQEHLAAALPDPAERLFWQAMRASGQGRLDDAEAAFSAAAQRGHRLAGAYGRQLAAGREIHRRLKTPGLAASDTVRAWAEWLDQHPGERVWKDIPSAVSSFAGAVGVYSIDRDAAFTMHRAESGQPVRLGFFGPTTLRVEARPLHRTPATAPIEGWLQVREHRRDGVPQRWVFPITQNVPADGLQMIGDDLQLPGRSVRAELPFGAGWHEVEIDGDSLPLIVRSQFAQSELRLPVLPLLTVDSVWRPEIAELAPSARDVLGCFSCTSLLPASADDRPERFRHGRRELGDNPARLSSPGFSARHELPSAPPDTMAAALAAGDWAAWLASEPASDADSLLRYLSGLLWLAEQLPVSYEPVLARASALAAAHPEIPALQPVMDRLLRNSAWVPLTAVRESAGQRSRITAEWEPESPALRVRRALLPPTATDEYLLSGGNRLVLSFFNPQPARFKLVLANNDVSGLLMQPLRVRIEIDGRSPRFVTLAANPAASEESLMLGSGEHSIRIAIETPLVGQFLRVGLSESGRPRSAEPVVVASERFYHVATAQSPLRAVLPGPLWLRIDRWTGTHTESSYRLLPESWNELELKPTGGSEALYRIFTLGMQAGQPVTPPRRIAVPPQPVPPPPLVLAARPASVGVRLHDGLPLGGQEDGTWSVYGGAQQRSFGRAENPGSHAPGGREKYLEAGATYRYYDAEGQSWYRADLLGRLRDEGGPTVGTKAAVLHAPSWSAWNFGAEAALFLQSPGGSDGDQLLHTASLRGFLQQRRALTTKLYHLPEVAVFGRHTSDQVAARMPIAYRRGGIDQDVFTSYLGQHQAGAELSDTLVYQPWLDSELYTRGGIVTNQDFRLDQPDRLSVSAGVRQLLGPGWVRLQYGHNRYLADGDRRQAQSARALSLNIGGELWQSGRHRLQVDLTLARDLTDRLTWGGLVLTWHGGNGRGYTDFRPGEIDFRDLRTRRMPSDDNNRMSDIFPQSDAP